MPRRSFRQTNRANTQSDTAEGYFKKVISIPFLDHLPQEMETKFTVLHNCATLGLMLIPAEVHK